MKKFAESSIHSNGSSHRNTDQEPSERLHLRNPHSRLHGMILLGMGIFQFFVFWFLYYSLELYIFACVSALIGIVLQIVGMIKLYMGVRSSSATKTLIGLMVGCTLLWAYLFVYYGTLITHHI